MKQMKKMGGLVKYLEYAAGTWRHGRWKQDLDIDADDEKKMARIEAIILFHDDRRNVRIRISSIHRRKRQNCNRCRSGYQRRSTDW